ncbi:hypothetical protein AB0F17_28645 [Nonomuraea sp. NPDC026600]|uniref:hypothetical protein n=1 Tax=Nonomuraea sp. NPDC026600 TaxID=3155363 RepID=UPI0033E0D25E
MFNASAPDVIAHARYRIEVVEAHRAYHNDVSLFDLVTGERLQQRRKVYDTDVNKVADLLVARQDAKGDPESPLTTAAQLRLLAERLAGQLDAAEDVAQHGEVMHHLVRAAHDLHMSTGTIAINQRHRAQDADEPQRHIAEQHATRASTAFGEAMAECASARNELIRFKHGQ